MNITAIRSDAIYKKMAAAITKEEKEDIFRNELMKPFEAKLQLIGIPLKSEMDGGYDVIAYTEMSGGYTPEQITDERNQEIKLISDDEFWDACETSIRNTLEGFEKHGIKLSTQNYIFTVQLSNPNHAMASMTGDYCGDGGFPGYITGTIIPNEKSLHMLPVALAHEANHNVRWQFMKWNPNITLADMVVSEGLAENYEAFIYGEEKVGIWATKTDTDTLNNIILPMVHENLMENDFNKLSTFLYGDEIMAMRGATPIGMPYCGGYACGYALIQHYLKKTGKSIYEATITTTQEILKCTEDFWN